MARIATEAAAGRPRGRGACDAARRGTRAGARSRSRTVRAEGAALSGDVATAVAGLGGAAAVAAVLIGTDPQQRRSSMAAKSGGDEMASVREYFNTSGFDRWKKIYGETDDVNKVQLDIRTGHAQTVDKVLGWLDADADAGEAYAGQTVCDAGCGTGSLSIPLAMRGATVFGSDISSAMAGEASRRYADACGGGGGAGSATFEAKDLESIDGKYDTVACLDVMIHYPQSKADEMITHLASLADKRIIVSFAPKTLAYSVLKRIGELFPGPSKATRAYLHAEADVVAALDRAGWEIKRTEMTATSFYFSRLLEARPKSA